MKQLHIYLFLLIAVFLFPKETQRDFGFGGMEIFQFKDDTSMLTIYDINGDGLDDILFLNNKASRLEVLIRKPTTASNGDFPLLNERFVKKGFILDQWVKFFRVVDLNADKRLDILCIGDQYGLVLHVQQPDGSFGEPVNMYVKDASTIVSMDITDLNGDSSPDIFICRQENAEILWNNGAGLFKTSSVLTFSSGGCRSVQVIDVDGDKKRDLLFYFGGDLSSIRVRRGLGSGEFGWEETIPVPVLYFIRKVNLESGNPGEENLQLAAMLQNGIVLRLYGLQQEKQGRLLDQVSVQTKRLPLMGITPKEPPAYVTGDFNNDGYSDFCTAAPLLNQLQIYMGGASGLNPIPRMIDSLTSIKTVKRTADGDIVVFSEAEKTIAIHPANDLEQFPSLFKATGKPVAMTVGQPSTVFGIFKDGDYRLLQFDAKKPSAGPVQSYDISLSNPPQEMMVFPLPDEQDKNRWMVILFMAYERPVVFKLSKGKLTPMGPEEFRALGLNLNAASVTDVSSGDDSLLLVSEDKVARLYRWKDGKFTVKRQLNPRRKSAKLSTACLFYDSDKKPGYLVYDESGQDLIWFAEPGKTNPIGIRFQSNLKDIIGIVPLRMKERTGLLLVGQSEIQWFQEDASLLALKTIGEYTSRAEKPVLWSVSQVKLGSPGRNMLALLDSNNNSVELVSLKNRQLVEELVFEVFQDPGFRETEDSFEPHGVGTGDFNGDKIQDMVILAHDKLIIYLGE